jgi:hypothetical protein
MFDEDKQKWIQENYPFFTYIKYGKKEYEYYLGILINTDPTITSLYNFERITTADQRRMFIELGEQWWWESNRLIPINIFLGSQISIFKPFIINMNSKDVEIVWGPETSLTNIIQKRIKRRSIQLVRKES